MKKPLLRTTLLGFSLALAVALPASAYAKTTKSKSKSHAAAQDSAGEKGDINSLMKALQEQSKRLNEQEAKMAEQEKAFEAQKEALTKQRLEFEKLQMQVVSVTGKPLPYSPMGKKQAEKAAEKKVAGADKSATPTEVGTDRKEAAKEKPPEIAAIIDEGGVLTKKGTLVVTPALEYSRSSVTSVAISGLSIVPAVNVGLFDISQANRDALTPSLSLRYGLTSRFEIEGKVPYVYRKDSLLQRAVGVPNAPEVLSSVNGSDIGDVELAGHYQITNGDNNWPYLVGNLRYKSNTGTSPFEVPVVAGQATELPTGSGFHAVQPSITAIYPTDPLVYYANMGYLHSFSQNYSNYGDVQPGDAYSASLGMSLSLNDKSSISFGYGHTTVLKTMVNDQPLSNSDVLQVGTLDLGYSYNLNERTNLNFTVSTGVTADAPDVRLIFRVPMSFNLR